MQDRLYGAVSTSTDTIRRGSCRCSTSAPSDPSSASPSPCRNGSTYKMIPTIFAGIGRAEAHARGLDIKATAVEFKRRAAAVIGIAGAIGAFGGFLIQVVLR